MASREGLIGHRRGALFQARACWRWSNFLGSVAADGKPVLRVNMDETNLKLHVTSRPGLVFEASPKRRRQLLRQGRGPSLHVRRSAVTLVAFACDDERVQKLLPQIFVVNEHVVTKAAVEDFASTCSGNVQIIRRKSSWVDAKLAAELIQTLAATLPFVRRSHRVILHLDASRVHSHVSVLHACSKAGLLVHFIPAATTPWFQPLDVAVFAKFKGWVVQEVERQRLASESGSLAVADVLGIYRRGVEEVVQTCSWERAFEHTGLRGQGHLSQTLLSRLGAHCTAGGVERPPVLRRPTGYLPTWCQHSHCRAFRTRSRRGPSDASASFASPGTLASSFVSSLRRGPRVPAELSSCT